MNAKKCDRCGKYYVTDGERVYYDGESITVFSNIGKKFLTAKPHMTYAMTALKVLKIG